MTRLPLPVPPPIDPSYHPKASITTVPASTPVDYIVAILERDGGVILKDLVSQDELDTIEEEVRPWSNKSRVHADNATNGDAFHIIPPQTTLVPGLVGKSKTVAQICERPVLEGLRQKILLEEYVANREGHVEPTAISPLLSLSMSMNIGYGAPRQLLHRDDTIHGIRHRWNVFQPWSFKHVSQFACLIAGCEVTRENGATMFVPGSHKWDDDRWPTADDVSFAGIVFSLVFSFRRINCTDNRRNVRWFCLDISCRCLPRWWPQLGPRLSPNDAQPVLCSRKSSHGGESVPCYSQE